MKDLRVIFVQEIIGTFFRGVASLFLILCNEMLSQIIGLKL